MTRARKNSVYDRFYVRLNLIFNGIVASSIIPFAFIFLQNRRDRPQPLLEGNTADTVKIICIVLSLGILIFANWQGPKLLAKARKRNSLKEKLNVYLGQKMQHYALIEAAAIISLVGFYLLKDQLFSFIYIGVIFVFSIHRPRFGRVAKELGVSETELAQLANNDSED